jgi:methylated-DNA-[protein]-cysteine S-methyltransferase
MNSPVGRLYLVASARALHAVSWRALDVTFAASLDQVPILGLAVTQLTEYFAGTRRAFDLPLAARGGTEFQRAVWRALDAIPYGQTRSYRDLARAVDRARAVRAVGSANGKNPLALVVPCHRVISSDGGLGGFSGGLAAKSILLELERGGG